MRRAIESIRPRQTCMMHPDGDPHADLLVTEQNIRDFREWVNHEIDLIRELIGEYSGQYKL